jgi:2-keto-4-pentenoate hydratase/2-oxohepta-3-ene-1,7-dioic acid hydratase in catechol pathway
MKLVTYQVGDGWRLGVVRDANVVGVVAPQNSASSPLRSFLLGGAREFERVHEESATKFASGREVQPLDELVLAPPVPDPDKVLCVGFNYAEHVSEMAAERPSAPNVFAKFRNSLIGSGHQIVLPKVSAEIDYEGELAAVIGQRCRGVEAEDALRYVGGYTILNDVSARDLQFGTSQWTLGKAIDTFAPVGPVLTTADEIPDPQSLALTTRLNGEVVQQSSTGAMNFSVAQIIAALSDVMTLEPGDIISTGTPSGVGWKRVPPRFLTAGDVVDVEISGIGILSNEVVKSDAKV